MRKSLVVYGVQVVKILLENEIERVATLFVADKKPSPQLERLASSKNIPIERMSMQRLDKLCDNDALHQGIAAAINSWPYYDEEDLYLLPEQESELLILVLDGIQDPHNLGACLRTADAAGVHAVILPKTSSVALTPTVCKVSCGAAFTTPIYRVSNLARTIDKLQKAGVWFIGTEVSAEQAIYDIDCTGNIGIIMGSEGTGIRSLTKTSCDYLISLPMHGIVESLNVSVSTGICLYEVIRQRQLAD